MNRRLSFGTVLMLVCGPVFGNSTADVVSKWGLDGVWRTNCSLPKSTTNSDRTFVLSGGQLVWEQDFVNIKTSVPVTSAVVRPDGALELTLVFPAGQSRVRQMVYARGSDGRVKVWENRDASTGELSVKDGALVANGAPTPWLSRCSR